MFNVIISSEPNVWETDQLMRLEHARFKEFSGGPEADRVDVATVQGRELLEKTPTLLLYEDNAEGTNPDVVRYGLIHDVRLNSQFVFFRFHEEGRLPRRILKEFETRIGVSRLEWKRTCTTTIIFPGDDD